MRAIHKAKLEYMNTNVLENAYLAAISDLAWEAFFEKIAGNEKRISDVVNAGMDVPFNLQMYRDLVRIREMHEGECRLRGMRYPC